MNFRGDAGLARKATGHTGAIFNDKHKDGGRRLKLYWSGHFSQPLKAMQVGIDLAKAFGNRLDAVGYVNNSMVI